jgi:exodeoxyribonuclease V alpha subunit
MNAMTTRQPVLTDFQQAGVLGLADVHTAMRLCTLAGETDERVLLAVAVAVAALRRGTVCLELNRFRDAAVDSDGIDAELAAQLPWPATADLVAALQASPLVVGGPAGPLRPLTLVDSDAGWLLYLDRYFRQEQLIRTALDTRAASRPTVDITLVRNGLEELFANDDGTPTPAPDRQRLAAAVTATAWTTIVAGGPGTGKTHTAARILALLFRLHGPRLRVALTAPTGKAAGTLTEAVARQGAALGLPDGLTATTVHRLLGLRRFGSPRSRYNATNQLPYDVVVVDETSMVSLTLMAQLLAALPTDCRLILMGDPDQLTSVDAGAVLDDLVHRPQISTTRADLITAVSADLQASTTDREPALDDDERRQLSHGVVRLTRGRRFNASIGALADAIRHGRIDDALALLNDPADQAVTLCPPNDLETVRADIASNGADLVTAAEIGDVESALTALRRHRLLCAHREGPFGRRHWDDVVRDWTATAVGQRLDSYRFYPGQPLLITANDYEAGVFNGDIGVVIATPGGVMAAIDRGGDPLILQPNTFSSVQTAYAMTVHRSQGSQYEAVSVVLPDQASPLLTRQLLYTAVTRAQQRVRILASEESVAAAITRQAQRASGLRRELGELWRPK